MAEEDYGVVPYKDISELKKQLEEMQDKKEISSRDLYDAVHKLSATMSDMLEVFGAAADQLKLEEKEYDAENKKHEVIIFKLDKLIDQNKTIAEGMVAIVGLVKEKFGKEEPVFSQRESGENMFKPKSEPNAFARPQPEWSQPPESMSRMQAMTPPPLMSQQSIAPQPPDAGQLPPMEPTPMLDLDLPDAPFPGDEEPRKKSLFGMFKK